MTTTATTLVRNGVSLCKIAHSPGFPYEKMGRRVAVRIREFTRVQPEYIIADQLTEEDWKQFHLILIGTVEDNPALARLVESQKWTPGMTAAQSFEIRVVIDPLGYNKNVLLLTGSDTASVKRAVDGFVLRMNEVNVASQAGFDEDDLVLPPLAVVHPPESK